MTSFGDQYAETPGEDELRVYRLECETKLLIVQAIVSGEAGDIASLVAGAVRNGLEAYPCRIDGRRATRIAAQQTIYASAERTLYVVRAATDSESYMTNTLEAALALKERPESTWLHQRRWVPIVYTSIWERVETYELLLHDERSAEVSLEVLSSSIGCDRNTITIAPPRGWQGYGWPIG